VTVEVIPQQGVQDEGIEFYCSIYTWNGQIIPNSLN
jgi:hypothetical protein